MKPQSVKILIIRLSSIGDIVLTTPVIRSLKKGREEVKIHFLVKKAFAPLLEHNPHIKKIHVFDGDLSATLKELKLESFHQIIDLHRSLRSWIIRISLRIPSVTFNKLNWKKMILTRFRINRLPKMHIVERYGETLASVNCSLDEEGLEIFLPPLIEENASKKIKEIFSEAPIAVVLGANHNTKKYPLENFPPLLNQLGKPLLLIGGPAEKEDARFIAKNIKNEYFNAVGTQGLLESAALMKQCSMVITHDTGFMHIAAAFGMKVFSIWGNTVPEFGMTPYKTDFIAAEVKGLACRPCHKLGHPTCPKGHFDCMRKQTPEKLAERISTWK